MEMPGRQRLDPCGHTVHSSPVTKVETGKQIHAAGADTARFGVARPPPLARLAPWQGR